MIIAYEKLTNSFRKIVRENLFHIGEWFILDDKNNVLHKFENINDLSSDILQKLNMLKKEIVTYRIYRDTRFSLDKTPYKTHFGGYINSRGKKSDHCGYYIHLEPGNSFLAGGSYCLPPKVLKAVRQSIFDNIDEYRGIVEDPNFKKYFPIVGDDFLKTAPKGFPKDFKYIDYLKCREYTCIYKVPNAFFSSSDFLQQTESIFIQFKRFADFLNYTIDDFE